MKVPGEGRRRGREREGKRGEKMYGLIKVIKKKKLQLLSFNFV